MEKLHDIPNKLYFRIGEVSDIVGVKPYVLRYWESEFPDIKPTKSKSGQRLYKRRDVEVLVSIKRLLYDERFTIDGARKRIKELGKVEQSSSVNPKQLEVFSLTAEEHVESSPEVERRTVQAVAGVDKKVFLKIKRDLESLLEIIRN